MKNMSKIITISFLSMLISSLSIYAGTMNDDYKEILVEYTKIINITDRYPVKLRMQQEQGQILTTREETEATEKEIYWDYKQVQVWNAIVEAKLLRERIKDFKKKYKKTIEQDRKERLEEMQKRLKEAKDKLRFIYRREFGELSEELRATVPRP